MRNAWEASHSLRACREEWDLFAGTAPPAAIELPDAASTIEEVLEQAGRAGLPGRRSAALDFGCGTGLVTQALSRSFPLCFGVDLSPRMVTRARERNPDPERCRFAPVRGTRLTLFGDGAFDLIHGNRLLWHLPPDLAMGYVADLLRTLAPRGLLVLDLPSHRPPPEGPEPVPLPEPAFRARIALREPPRPAPPGTEVPLRVLVRNTSPLVWPGTPGPDLPGTISLGNHWLIPAGGIAVQDDGRVALPRDLSPGEEIELTLPVRAPEQPGDWLLELDLVQEAVTWFAARGSDAARVPFHVQGPSSGALPPLPPPPGVHGIHRAEVLDFIHRAGFRVLDVHERAEAPWIACRYLVAPPEEGSLAALPPSRGGPEETGSTDATIADLIKTWTPHGKYYADAEATMEAQWRGLIHPLIQDSDFTTVLELAPGHGRNSAKLVQLSGELHLVDAAATCIRACQKRFRDYSGPCRLHYHVNDGSSLAQLPDGSITFIYSWDAAVHFDRAIMKAYIGEFARVLAPGGTAFIHHSHYGAEAPDSYWRHNPSWRGNVSRELFARYCAEAGLVIERQQLLPWNDLPDLDCLTLFGRPLWP